MIEWNNSFLTGHETIDAEHKHLIELLNALELTLRAGSSDSVMRDLIRELEAYTKYHFQREEVYMEQVHCPAKELNCAAHKSLLAKVATWVERSEKGEGVSLALEVFREGSQWIRDHILRVDCRLKECRRPEAQS